MPGPKYLSDYLVPALGTRAKLDGQPINNFETGQDDEDFGLYTEPDLPVTLEDVAVGFYKAAGLKAEITALGVVEVHETSELWKCTKTEK